MGKADDHPRCQSGVLIVMLAGLSSDGYGIVGPDSGAQDAVPMTVVLNADAVNEGPLALASKGGAFDTHRQ